MKKKIEKIPDDKKYYEESEFVEEVIEKLNQIIDHLNSQVQPEEIEPEKVYVEPIEFNYPEHTARVEWKSREEIADNLQAQFEYGRWGIAKDLEAASKESKKDEDKIALETYKQATQDTPEEWVEKLWKLIDAYRDSKDITSELERIEEVNQYVKQLLEEREKEASEEVIRDLIKKIEDAHCDSISLELLKEIDLSKLKDNK